MLSFIIVRVTAAVWGTMDGPRIAVRPLNKEGRPGKSSWRGTNSLPSWSWEGCEGKSAQVEVFSNAQMVALYLNGIKLDQKKVKDYKASFKVKYQPGELVAVAYGSNNAELGRDKLVTATGAKSIRIQAEQETVKAGKVCYVQIDVVGENGEIESNHDCKLKVSVEGGKLLGFGSANPRTEESYVSGEFTTYYGHAQAIIQAADEGKMTILISDGKKAYEKAVKITE